MAEDTPLAEIIRRLNFGDKVEGLETDDEKREVLIEDLLGRIHAQRDQLRDAFEKIDHWKNLAKHRLRIIDNNVVLADRKKVIEDTLAAEERLRLTLNAQKRAEEIHEDKLEKMTKGRHEELSEWEDEKLQTIKSIEDSTMAKLKHQREKTLAELEDKAYRADKKVERAEKRLAKIKKERKDLHDSKKDEARLLEAQVEQLKKDVEIYEERHQEAEANLERVANTQREMQRANIAAMEDEIIEKVAKWFESKTLLQYADLVRQRHWEK